MLCVVAGAGLKVWELIRADPSGVCAVAAPVQAEGLEFQQLAACREELSAALVCPVEERVVVKIADPEVAWQPVAVVRSFGRRDAPAHEVHELRRRVRGGRGAVE